MSALKVIIPLGLGVAGLVALASSAKADAKPKADSKPMPEALVQEISDSLKSADPLTMRKTAARVKAAGYPEQAKSINEAADDIEAAIKKTQIVSPSGVATTSAGQPTKVQPAGTPVVTPQDNTARVKAGALALHLTHAKKWQENREQVKEYQAQEKVRGFYTGILDGIYGAKTAITLAEDHGIVPPTPMYWPKANPNGAKREYRDRLLALAAKDPARREEWQTAAARV